MCLRICASPGYRLWNSQSRCAELTHRGGPLAGKDCAPKRWQDSRRRIHPAQDLVEPTAGRAIARRGLSPNVHGDIEPICTPVDRHILPFPPLQRLPQTENQKHQGQDTDNEPTHHANLPRKKPAPKVCATAVLRTLSPATPRPKLLNESTINPYPLYCE